MDTEARIVREILRQNEFLLRRHLVLSKTVLDAMRAEGMLTETSKRKIMMEPTHRQVGVLIQSLEYKGLASMKKFLGILRQTGHGWMVDNLLDTDVSMSKMRDDSETSSLRYRDHSASSSVPQRRVQGYRQAVRKSFERKSLTAGHTAYGLGSGDRGGATLEALLRAREPAPDPHSMTRGIINTRDLLANQNGAPPLYPELGQPMHQSNHRSMAGLPGSLQDVPSTLYSLNQAFSKQDEQNQQAMNILRQEETAIRQLLEQNARDQGQVRRKQVVVGDIVGRLKDIHIRANAAYDPSPHPNIGRYRLSQLNQIPWSIGR